MDLKARRDKEHLLHKAFYKTIYNLTLIYPPSGEFESVFKEDMFLKNNKNGFHQVAFYILNILALEKLKQDGVFLPYDIKTEKQFNTYIVNFVGELNTHSDASIPVVAMSQLTSPSGFKFILFMLKLSQWTLMKYLESEPTRAARLLTTLRTSNNSKVTFERLSNLKKVNNHIHEESNRIQADFETHLAKCKVDAAAIVTQQDDNSRIFKENQLKLKMLEAKLKDIHQHSETTTSADIKKKLEFLNTVYVKSNEYALALSTYLSSKNANLEHDKCCIPLVDDKPIEVLDLKLLLEKFIKELDIQRLKVEPMSNDELTEQIDRFRKLNEDVQVNEKKVRKSIKECSRFCEEYEDGKSAFLTGLENDSESSPLAMPLPESPNVN